MILQTTGKMLSKELAVRNTVYCCTFFQEINSDGSFHVLETLSV